MPPGVSVRPLGARDYGYSPLGVKHGVRVTTNPAYYEEHGESVELWSPGSPLFPIFSPEDVATASEGGRTELEALL
jgi:hypothetical protein